MFRASDIDIELLGGLTNDDLKDIGVASFGHRKKLLEAIAELRFNERRLRRHRSGTGKHSTNSLRIAATTNLFGFEATPGLQPSYPAPRLQDYTAWRIGPACIVQREETALPILEIRVARSTDVPD
jgi:hypothetical protein